METSLHSDLLRCYKRPATFSCHCSQPNSVIKSPSLKPAIVSSRCAALMSTCSLCWQLLQEDLELEQVRVNSLTHMVVVVDESSGDSATAALESKLQVGVHI